MLVFGGVRVKSGHSNIVLVVVGLCQVQTL
jgi:hypothetical protein